LRAALSELRMARGITQTQLADRLGRSQTFVSKYELDERQLRVVEFMDICEVLKVDPRVVIGELLKVLGEVGEGSGA
jgi:transcriptional regulator with XRE-family HTH domain